MRFYHMEIFVSDVDDAIFLWRDILGFGIDYRKDATGRA